MFTLILTILIIICVLINFKVYKNIINYLNIFLIMYYLIMLLSNSGIYGFSIPSEKTNAYLLIALISLEFFSFLFMKIKLNVEEVNKKEILNRKRLLFISIVVTILMIPTTIEGIKILSEQGFTAVRSAAFSDDIYSSYTKIFLVYILMPLNKVIYIYSLLDYVENKKIKLPIVFSVVNVFQIVATLGGRSVLLDFIMISVVIVFEKYNRKIFEIFKKNKKIIIISALLLIMMVAVTNDRSLDDEKGVIFNLYSYYVGSIHLFDIHLQNPEISLLDGEHLLYGKGILNPLLDISKIALKTIGINTDIVTGTEIINEQVQQYITVKNGLKMNNNVTFLYVCLRDFDIYGLIIGPAYIALWFSVIYKLYIKKKCIKTDALYFYLVSILPYFVFEFYINKTTFLSTIIFIILIYNFVYTRKERKNEKQLYLQNNGSTE